MPRRVCAWKIELLGVLEMSNDLYKTFIKEYLQEQGIFPSQWSEYKVLYNRYRVRCLKYSPTNYSAFLNLCTFAKQTKKSCGAKDLGESRPKERPFNEKKWWKDQKKEWKDYKLRMKHYRDDRIHNTTQIEMSEKGRMKDFPPYMFLQAMRCLSGRLPAECFPENLSDYREELQNILDEERGVFENL